MNINENKINMISELEIKHLSCFKSFKNMNLTLQHPKILRTVFLCWAKLNNLNSYENLRSVCHDDSNGEKEFKKLPNIKVVLKYF